MKIIAAANSDSTIRRASSAGGVFSLLAENVLSRGGVVYGVRFSSEWNIVHTAVEAKEDLYYLRGSKYAYSNIGDAIQQAKTALSSGRYVLFSGTPCQVAAMARAAECLGCSDHLLLVEVVCHGAPEHKYWERYLDAVCARLGRSRADIVDIRFRDKRTGWKNYSFTIRFTDGQEFTQPHGGNLYMRAFLLDYTVRQACFRCPFKYPDGSRADITLGDLWGIGALAPEIDNDLGTTTVIARTERGEQAIANIKAETEFTLDAVARYNPAITKPTGCPERRNRFDRDAAAPGADILRVMRRYTRRPLRVRIRRLLSSIKHTIIR